MPSTKDVLEKILAGVPLEWWCAGCSNTTYQIKVEVLQPRYEDAVTYQCQGCRSIRYYSVEAPKKF